MVQELCAGGIVFYGDDVLILTNFRQDVVFPKGHLELGETPEEAALREVAEEAGITAEILTGLGKTSYSFFAHYDRALHHKTVYWFLMRAKNKTICCDGVEIKRGQYVSVKEALSLLTFELDREKLHEAHAQVLANSSWTAESPKI